MKTFSRCAFVTMLWVLLCLTGVAGQATRREGPGGAAGKFLPDRSAPAMPRHATAVPLPAGTYTIGSGGNFPSIDSAFIRLHADGIAGAVTLLLKDTLYVAPSNTGDFRLVGPIAGAGPGSRITIRPAENVAATIRGSGTATLTFEDASYVTLDGISLQGNTRLRVHTVVNPSYGWNDAIDLWKNCDYVVLQNLTASSDDYSRLATTTIALIGDVNGVPDSCLVTGVAVTSGAQGIFVGGGYPSYPFRLRGNVIRGNHIGSPTDSLISRGIQVEGIDGILVENNHVENLRISLPDAYGDRYILGINAYFCSDAVIRNNIVHNICATMPRTYIDGILLSGSESQRGVNMWVYNNIVYDILNRVSETVDLNGIGAWRQDSSRIDYNSISLPATGSVSASLGSAALGFYSTVNASTARNNILVNLRQEQSNIALAIWFGGTGRRMSDHNDLFVGAYDSSFLALYEGKRYKTLGALNADGRELYSVSVMPPFVSSQNLHITNTPTALADAATPIAGITADIDGNPRPHVGHSTPDIGADEFDHPAVGVDPERGLALSFALEQNYPNPFNPRTVIRYQHPVSGHVQLAVYDLLGREVVVLVNEKQEPGLHEVPFDATDLSSGMYVYRLTAGGFVQSRRMLLVR